MRIRYLLIHILIVLMPSLCLAQQDTVRSVLKDTTVLDEIIISAKTAVKISGDTISYTVDSFYKDPLATTEDVLKRLPGVEVSRDGKITIQGKEVAKIFINGKEYQAGDIRTITQNLPAEILEKIQVADWYDEEAQFSGIKKESTAKSINLKFKKQYEKGVFGRAAAGYGTRDRYQAGVFASFMGSALRLTAISNVNNTGIADATNDAGADNARSGNIPGVQTRKQTNLNFSYDKEKLHLAGLYEISGNNTNMIQSLLRNTYLPGDSLLIRNQASQQLNRTLQHRLNIHSRYRISEKLNMTTYIDGTVRTADMNNDSRDITYYNAEQTPDFMRHSVSASKNTAPGIRFSNLLQRSFDKKGRTLSLNVQANYTGNTTDGTNENTNTYYATALTNTNTFETDELKNNLDTRVNIKYTEPLSANSTLSFDYTNLYTTGTNDRKVYKTAAGNGYMLDSIQSRYYENRNMENPAGVLYQYNAEKLTAGAGVDVQPYSRKSHTVNRTDSVVSQQGVNYFPNVFSRYRLSGSSNLNLNYSGSIVSPGINLLQPVPDYTDSLNIFIGNPFLRPEVSNNITIGYNFYDTKKQQMFWANIRANWTNNKIINSVDINASKKVTTPVNINGAYNIGLSCSYTWPLLDKKIKASVSLNGSTVKNITITNDRLQQIVNYNYQPGLKLLFTSISWFEGELNYTYRYNNINIATTNTPALTQVHNFSAGGTFFLPRDFKFGYLLDYTFNKGLTQGYQQNFLLMHLRLDKVFKKPAGLSARIQAFDVLNNYPNVQRIVGDNYYEDRSYNRIGRYLMLSLIYRFSWFPASGHQAEQE